VDVSQKTLSSKDSEFSFQSSLACPTQDRALDGIPRFSYSKTKSVAENSTTIPQIVPLSLADTESAHKLELLCSANPWSARLIEQELAQGKDEDSVRSSINLGVQIDGVLSGFVFSRLVIDESHIMNLVVHPDGRRQGLGARLLKTALAMSSDRGARVAYLEVRASNDRAQRLYKRGGFSVLGRRPNYYRNNGEDALLMSCPFKES